MKNVSIMIIHKQTKKKKVESVQTCAGYYYSHLTPTKERVAQEEEKTWKNKTQCQ